MEIINPRLGWKPTQAQIDDLKAYTNARERSGVEAIRAAVPSLAATTDGELHQIALDAGLTVKI